MVVKMAAIHIELLACKFISTAARNELARAACPIHKEVPGLDSDIEVVELQHAGKGDRNGMYRSGVPVEIQIASRGLYLAYHWDDQLNGFGLTWLDEDIGMVRMVIYDQQNLKMSDEELGDLDDHPF